MGAFNSIDHRKLIEILRDKYRVGGTLLTWIKIYVDGRGQRVKWDGLTSAVKPVKCGIPEGTVLGPLIFNLYINLVTKGSQSKYHWYADDSAIYRFKSDLPRAVQNINNHVRLLEKNYLSVRIRLNFEKKTQALIVGTQHKLRAVTGMSSTACCYVNGIPIDFSEVITYVGEKIGGALT